MITTVYCPCGIVISTFKEDYFLDVQHKEEQTICMPIRMVGLPHFVSFWNRYVMVYKLLGSYNYDNRLENLVQMLQQKWEKPPSIADLMPYVKKMLMDNNVQLIGVMAGYALTENGDEPYVYQILGHDIYRVNRDESGRLHYNYLCLEENTTVKKLFENCKLANGDRWEEYEETKIRCDLFSIDKAIDFCKFTLFTNRYVNHLNMVMYDDPLLYDMVVVTPSEIKQMDNIKI